MINASHNQVMIVSMNSIFHEVSSTDGKELPTKMAFPTAAVNMEKATPPCKYRNLFQGTLLRKYNQPPAPGINSASNMTGSSFLYSLRVMNNTKGKVP